MVVRPELCWFGLCCVAMLAAGGTADAADAPIERHSWICDGVPEDAAGPLQVGMDSERFLYAVLSTAERDEKEEADGPYIGDPFLVLDNNPDHVLAVANCQGSDLLSIMLASAKPKRFDTSLPMQACLLKMTASWGKEGKKELYSNTLSEFVRQFSQQCYTPIKKRLERR